MAEPRYPNVVAIVEATSYERRRLWMEHASSTMRWAPDNSGPMISVGTLDNRSICIAPFVYNISGKEVMFLEVTSEVVDWKMITEWLQYNCPNAVDSQSTKLNKVDANNFHNVLHGW